MTATAGTPPNSTPTPIGSINSHLNLVCPRVTMVGPLLTRLLRREST